MYLNRTIIIKIPSGPAEGESCWRALILGPGHKEEGQRITGATLRLRLQQRADLKTRLTEFVRPYTNFTVFQFYDTGDVI